MQIDVEVGTPQDDAAELRAAQPDAGTQHPIDPDEQIRAASGASRMPLITALGLVAGDVLLHLERSGATTLRLLVRELKWPVQMIMMGVGALIREGLVRGVAQDVDVLVEPMERA